MTIEWDKIAQNYMFSSAKRMLIEYYYVHEKSHRKIADIIGVSSQIVILKMEELNLPRRDKGGPNNLIGKGATMLRCPSCSNVMTRITHSLGTDEDSTILLRRRKCEKCEKIFRTEERTVEKYS